jgi:hypothetical protein
MMRCTRRESFIEGVGVWEGQDIHMRLDYKYLKEGNHFGDQRINDE